VRGTAGESVVQVVGREWELGRLREFLEADRFPRALVLTGGPGIGKTTLWEAGVAEAHQRGFRVLLTRASDAETQLSFAGLIDLLDTVDVDVHDHLPAPQARALEVALLRADSGGAPPAPGAIALGVLNALRTLAASDPVLLAVDDVRWLDSPSTDVLSFAARRLDADAVGFLLNRRSGRVSGLERALEPRLERLELGPLSLGALQHLLSERLGLRLPRHVMRRLAESTLGNPLFALEVGRVLVEQGPPAAGEPLPVPDVVEDLLGTRVSRLRPPLRRPLLAVSLSGELRAADLLRLVGPAAVEEAVDAGLLIVDGGRVRASHPLLAAAARKRSRVRDRRMLHLDLAGVVTDQELRARHLALAADAPDEELAATIAAAAAAASARGGRQEAVELAEQALRLTPPDSDVRGERVLALATYVGTTGDLQRVTDLLTPEIASLPSGPRRAHAWLLLAEGGHIRTLDDYRQHLARALAEAQDDRVLRARVVAKMSSAVIAVERIREAEAQALEVLPDARAEPDVERLVLLALAWARSLRGFRIDDLCERFEAASGLPAHMTESPDRVAGQRLVWRGELDRGRVTFNRLLAIADERGEEGSYALHRLHLCELALRAGAWEEASRLLDDWAESAERDFLLPPMYERCRALLAAGRGVPDEAERWATEAIGRAEEMGTQWDWLEALRARGIAALLAHEPAQAVESVRTVWEHTKREGVDEPGVFPVVPELVEALVEVGEPDEARAVTARLRRLSEQQEHPWGLATSKRCAALVRLASAAYDEEDAMMLEQAAAEYGEFGLRFDRARSLLLVGRGRRRHRKWAAARGSLEEAVAAFEELGSPGWAEEARSQLARIGGRPRRAGDELTPAERRVAELAASGLSNKEIAQALFVTVNTVEVHLSRVYAKLGIRRRAQLAARLSAGGDT
jgi:DNA-binding CsgD family transcriptional regulator